MMLEPPMQSVVFTQGENETIRYSVSELKLKYEDIIHKIKSGEHVKHNQTSQFSVNKQRNWKWRINLQNQGYVPCRRNSRGAHGWFYYLPQNTNTSLSEMIDGSIQKDIHFLNEVDLNSGANVGVVDAETRKSRRSSLQRTRSFTTHILAKTERVVATIDGLPLVLQTLAANECVVLNLANTSLGDSGIKELSTSIAAALSAASKTSMPPISTLDLSWNEITEDGALEFSKLLKDFGGISPTVVRLDGNTITGPGLKDLLSAFKPSSYDGTSRLELSLRETSIGDDGVDVLLPFLSSLPITTLDLSACNIYDGAIPLALSLHTNTALQTLVLNDNMVGDMGAFAIGECLSSNSSLSHICLRNCDVATSGVTKLCEGMLLNTRLKSLDLGLNPWGLEAELHLQNIILNKSSIALKWRDSEQFIELESEEDVKMVVDHFGIEKIIDIRLSGMNLVPLIDLDILDYTKFFGADMLTSWCTHLMARITAPDNNDSIISNGLAILLQQISFCVADDSPIINIVLTNLAWLNSLLVYSPPAPAPPVEVKETLKPDLGRRISISAEGGSVISAIAAIESRPRLSSGSFSKQSSKENVETPVQLLIANTRPRSRSESKQASKDPHQFIHTSQKPSPSTPRHPISSIHKKIPVFKPPTPLNLSQTSDSDSSSTDLSPNSDSSPPEISITDDPSASIPEVTISAPDDSATSSETSTAQKSSLLKLGLRPSNSAALTQATTPPVSPTVSHVVNLPAVPPINLAPVPATMTLAPSTSMIPNPAESTSASNSWAKKRPQRAGTISNPRTLPRNFLRSESTKDLNLPTKVRPDPSRRTMQIQLCVVQILTALVKLRSVHIEESLLNAGVIENCLALFFEKPAFSVLHQKVVSLFVDLMREDCLEELRTSILSDYGLLDKIMTTVSQEKSLPAGNRSALYASLVSMATTIRKLNPGFEEKNARWRDFVRNELPVVNALYDSWDCCEKPVALTPRSRKVTICDAV